MKITKTILVVLFSLSFIGCAHQVKRGSIKESALDGLRFESLSRYNHKRLETIKTNKSELAACHDGRYNEALNSFKSTLDKDKNNAKYWNTIATCYLLKRELPKAKFYYDLALKTSGSKRMKAVINNNLGLYFNLRGLDSLAIHSFKESIKMNSELLTPKYNLGKLYLRFGLYKKAKTILTSLYKLAPKDIDFVASLGHLSLMTGNYKKAKWYYNQMPKEYLKRDSHATNYAMALFMTGDFKAAKSTISNADQNDSYYTLTQTKILKKMKYED